MKDIKNKHVRKSYEALYALHMGLESARDAFRKEEGKLKEGHRGDLLEEKVAALREAERTREEELLALAESEAREGVADARAELAAAVRRPAPVEVLANVSAFDGVPLTDDVKDAVAALASGNYLATVKASHIVGSEPFESLPTLDAATATLAELEEVTDKLLGGATGLESALIMESRVFEAASDAVDSFLAAYAA